jgi:hypothetical protein
MKSGIKHFFFELKRNYSRRFIITFIVFIFIVLIPVFLLIRYVYFSPSEFINIYLSTIFTAILIGLILQLLELYKSSLNRFSSIASILKSLKTLCQNLKEDIDNADPDISFYKELLSHYQLSILNSLVSDDNINKKLISIYKCDHLEYIKESIDNKSDFTTIKKNELLSQIDSFQTLINKTMEDL